MNNKNLFKEIFYQSSIPQLIGRKDFTEMLYNPAFCSFSGYTMEELLSISIHEVSHPDDIDKDMQFFSEIMAGTRDEYQMEKRYIHKSGQIKTGILNVSKISGESPDQDYLLAQILDITEKKQIETQLRIREQKYRLLAENSSDIIMLHHVDFSYLYVSPSVTTLLGYQPAEMIGRSPRDFIHPEERESLRKLRLLVKDSAPNLVSYRCRRKDGTYIWLESSVKALTNENGEVNEIVSVSRDIGERIETNEQLRRSEKLAVVGQTAAAVAHEIRNPLTAIKGFMQLFLAEEKVNPAFSKIMLDELNRVETIISEFLTMSKPHSEKSVSVQIDQLIEQVIQLLQSQALMKNKEIHFERIHLEVEPIAGDPNSLKQVFMNVIQNSLDSLSEKGTVKVGISTDSTGVFVHIHDNGCGIPKERLEKLGEPFYSTKEKGTGLGLMTSFRIIEHHNGKMKIDSEEGKGTTVTIWLPKPGT
jgi:two-component system sporulation sensor kinase A